jgi:glyoxylase I family protein
VHRDHYRIAASFCECGIEERRRPGLYDRIAQKTQNGSATADRQRRPGDARRHGAEGSCALKELHARSIGAAPAPDARVALASLSAPMEIIGLDHLYIAVSDFAQSENFYDRVMRALGFFKGDRLIAGERHAHYFNRALQISIRPARSQGRHDPYAPGLHHLCLQAADRKAVDDGRAALVALGVEATPPQLYPEYADDYYATFFADPDGVRFEIVARRASRDETVREWSELRSFLNPLQDLRDRRR